MTTPDPAIKLAEETALWLEVLRRRLDMFETRIDRFDEALSENNEATARIDKNTAEVVSLLHSWKGAIKTADGIGKVLRPLAMIVGALATIAGSIWGFFHMGGAKP